MVRAGYGIFSSGFLGNVTASALVGPPYWSYESLSFAAASLQRWETAFPADPTAFIAPSVIAPAWDVKPQKAHEWNFSVQVAAPFRSALTVSYVGNHIFDAMSGNYQNEVKPGAYTDIQSVRPYPKFSQIVLYQNLGDSWYNSAQVKWERRFAQGFSFLGSYALGKLMVDGVGPSIWTYVTPFAPQSYNRGRSDNDRKHIMTLNGIWDLPVGRGKKYMANAHPVLNGVLGGWQLTAIYYFVSGAPLSFNAPGATLGNGFGTRANVTGDFRVSNPSAAGWFNAQAFSSPAAYAFGDSAMGLMDGPATHNFDTGLMKNFNFTEAKYLQFRWEMFNMPNHVNLSNPDTTIGYSTTGKIFSAGSARSMQLGLKFIF